MLEFVNITINLRALCGVTDTTTYYDKHIYQKPLIISSMSDTIENVLILQGGGSLGAFGCGVLKALASSNIKIDIIAGTSIGGTKCFGNSR